MPKVTNMKLYYHQTDGGAEYLTDKYIVCPDGSKEGVFKGSRVIVRIDGDIREDAEITLVGVTMPEEVNKRIEELKSFIKACLDCGSAEEAHDFLVNNWETVMPEEE